MEYMNLHFGPARSAGLACFSSPCVLTLTPNRRHKRSLRNFLDNIYHIVFGQKEHDAEE